jgi:two-component system, LytTR family, sensor histidine kinase AlgZ
MISVLKKYKIILIVAVYILLLVLGDTLEDAEAEITLMAFLFTFILILYWLFVQIKSVIRLKSEKSKTELLHLKSQVNPHFFFNTLNNLYGLVEKDPKKAQQLILLLSDMMRYSIYDGQKDEVALEDEIKYLNHYIDLNIGRYHKKTDVKFTKHIQKDGLMVMPLLFIILLENAFKHGVENLSKDAYVSIQLIANEGEISFAIENNFDPSVEVNEQGIGLKNLTRRLELTYPKKHSLAFSKNNNMYRAQLTLKA